jgi:hypothetical protein
MSLHTLRNVKVRQLFYFPFYRLIRRHSSQQQHRYSFRSIGSYALIFHSIAAALTQVTCAKNHTCAVDDAGMLYTWGQGDQGTLGQPQESYQPTPTLVPTLARVTHVTAAECHTVCLVAASQPHKFWNDITEKNDVNTLTFLKEENSGPAVEYAGFQDDLSVSSAGSAVDADWVSAFMSPGCLLHTEN